MDKQKVIDYLREHINNSDNNRRKAFNKWKNDKAFFYAGIVINGSEDKP